MKSNKKLLNSLQKPLEELGINLLVISDYIYIIVAIIQKCLLEIHLHIRYYFCICGHVYSILHKRLLDTGPE